MACIDFRKLLPLVRRQWRRAMAGGGPGEAEPAGASTDRAPASSSAAGSGASPSAPDLGVADGAGAETSAPSQYTPQLPAHGSQRRDRREQAAPYRQDGRELRNDDRGNGEDWHSRRGEWRGNWQDGWQRGWHGGWNAGYWGAGAWAHRCRREALHGRPGGPCGRTSARRLASWTAPESCGATKDVGSWPP